jgi:hypothetical protein
MSEFHPDLKDMAEFGFDKDGNLAEDSEKNPEAESLAGKLWRRVRPKKRVESFDRPADVFDEEDQPSDEYKNRQSLAGQVAKRFRRRKPSESYSNPEIDLDSDTEGNETETGQKKE